MSYPILLMLLKHKSFRDKLSDYLSIISDDIDDTLTTYNRTIENEDSWFSLIVFCKNGSSHNITTRRLPHKTSWEFKS